ncbi:Defensin-like protein [Medicago truncatula]|uniref:Defensin-like protein n=1 Tax=Medicago truncatula TaxID=3880 RepID=A0A072TL66_MEDTR|nr:Defensin-like protein [Medicago truncatula]
MTSSSPKFYTIFLFLSLALLLFSTWEVQADICRKRSKTWGDPCFTSENCNRYCIKSENGVGGICMSDGIGFTCFCEFIC